MNKYIQLLDETWKSVSDCDSSSCSRPPSRLEFIAERIFDFTTYDGEKSELFGRWALAVCDCISARTTFEFIKDEDQYKWYLVMVNMPFFASKIEWGTSIRGAWWNDVTINGWTFVKDDKAVEDDMVFTVDEWNEFVAAMIEFASLDLADSPAPSRTEPT